MAVHTESNNNLAKIEQLEEIKQRPALESIKASVVQDKQQYEYAIKKLASDDKKWEH